MKTYWDTSAAVNAAFSPQVFDRLETGQHVTRLHLLAEFFSTMTDRGIKYKDAQGNNTRIVFDPDDCAEWLESFCQKVELVELTKEETLDTMRQAKLLNVKGANIYDFMHAQAAIKAGANEILTRNMKDFQGKSGNVKLAWP